MFVQLKFIQCIPDGNNDGNLTVEEFVALPPGDVEDPEQLKMDKKWQEERRREFKYTIDRNRDGIATRKEVEVFIVLDFRVFI